MTTVPPPTLLHLPVLFFLFFLTLYCVCQSVSNTGQIALVLPDGLFFNLIDLSSYLIDCTKSWFLPHLKHTCSRLRNENFEWKKTRYASPKLSGGSRLYSVVIIFVVTIAINAITNIIIILIITKRPPAGK